MRAPASEAQISGFRQKARNATTPARRLSRLRVLALSLLATCSAHARVPIGTLPADAAGLDSIPFVAVRSVETDRDGFRYYAAGRGEPTAGRCTVDVGARREKQVVGLRAEAAGDAAALLTAPSGQVVVYVHGYNVEFEQACREAAALQRSLDLEGRLLLFSWPAEGALSAYLRDVGDLEWSISPLREVLLALAEHFGSQNVAVIGHSLGSKGVVDALLAAGETRSEPVVAQLILVAPDIDADVFVRDVSRLSALVSSVTIYTSEQDRALKASRNVHDAPRLGDGAVDLSRFQGLEVVEVVQRHWWWWNTGHHYHLKSQAVIADLRDVLARSTPTPGRRTLYAGSQ